jgi:phosphate transport system permease protein
MDAEQYGEEAGIKNMNNTSNIDPSIFAKRKRANKIGLSLSMGAMLLGMVFLLWILSVLVIKGFSAIDLSLLLIAHLRQVLMVEGLLMRLLEAYF